MGELYSPDRYTTIRYYDFLLKSIPEIYHTTELTNFLSQTAHSEDVEYKVSRQFAIDQLTKSGFELVESIKAWPNEESTLGKGVGIFIEIWKLI